MYQLIKERDEGLLGHARAALLIPDLLGYWLTGQRRTELTNASTTGLIDPLTRTWATDLVELTGIEPGLFPELIQPGQPLGSLTSTVQAATSLALDTRVVAVGSHDTASAVVGVPAVDSNFAYIACGTWGLVGVELAAPVLSAESLAANFTNELGVDGTVRYLRNVMGLWVLQQCQLEWVAAGEVSGITEIVAAAAAEPPGGPVIDIDDPSLLAPGPMESRVLRLCEQAGQRVPLTVGQTARCVLDSLALAFARTVRAAAELSGHPVEVIHLVGGGAQNALLCQLTADLAGLPVVAGPVEATAIGNVLVQARAYGTLSGGLADLRALIARTETLTRYHPR